MTAPILTKQSAKGTVEFFLVDESRVQATLHGTVVAEGTPEAAWPRIKAQYPQFNWWLGKVSLTDTEYSTIKEALDKAKSPAAKARENLAALQSEREFLLNAYRGWQEQQQYEFDRLFDNQETDAAFKVKAEYEVKIEQALTALKEFDRQHPEAKPVKTEINHWM